MEQLPTAARRFITTIVVMGSVALGVVLVAGAGQTSGRQSAAVCLLLAALVFVGELRPIVIARGDARDEITVSTTFALALLFVGPLWVAMAVHGGAVALQDTRSRKGAVKVLFNAAQYVLTVLVARVTFALLSGHPLLEGGPLRLPEDLPAALAAGAAFLLVNKCLTCVVAALVAGKPFLGLLRSDVRFELATSGVLLTFSPVVAAAAHLSLWLVPLLLLPIEAIHRSAQLAADREWEALHDGLTGLPNRALFRLRVQRACEASRRSGRPFAVILLDLDHFKEINDTLGHHVGDDLLRVVATRLQDSVRPDDTVARLGGDEFVILVTDLAVGEQACDVATRLIDALVEPFLVDDVRLEIGASLGVALHPDHGDHVDLLLQRADIALYGAKVERGRYKLYEAADDVHTPARLTLAAELREGMERGELFLQHQPKVDVLSGTVVGFESLVRWRHPERGVVMPDQFLPVVENTGLITPLTLTVLDLALSAVAEWRAAGHDVTVAVNLSVRHLTDLGLPRQVDEALRKHGVPASALVLEVTETLIMSDPVRATDVLRLLRELGVALAVDDYGTGYSSLAYLRRLDVHELKIDRSFVKHITSDEGHATIVRSTIEMGHNLGLRLVAEGVEDAATLDLLRGWGCGVAQGYHLSRPLDLAAVLPWLGDRATRRLPALVADEPQIPLALGGRLAC
ncbi:MAG: diguanylate cyclase/phosphodiesterase (GGDEF & EAL domains) with PAS/PAC sensor(s) [uncultured Frankineae bacterium]|uniref:Diguanylate cyclase/phosphodiesterase (GGDEF & EAL domains) with PAS/PAC sensor(S) n=1 Tax=uncultured Frankineae bacterium TaxID=437475 RepID=A0A6J4L8E8_9ACTN|nr:MAG: diguanylate cyclase/phosphodiesterase (GGDEF & EAL domains) with PAS/PAC sensor(s) [uncultured Frankineae bacterium]